MHGYIFATSLRSVLCNTLYIENTERRDGNKGKYLGIIHLVHTQDFPKNQYFLPPDTHTYRCVSGG